MQKICAQQTRNIVSYLAERKDKEQSTVKSLRSTHKTKKDTVPSLLGEKKKNTGFP